MLKLAQPLAPRDLGWIELRQRLARAAREMHFFAFSADAPSSAAVLAISRKLAELAMTIPLDSSHIESVGLIDASTLFAKQVLQLERSARDNRNPAE